MFNQLVLFVDFNSFHPATCLFDQFGGFDAWLHNSCGIDCLFKYYYFG